MKYWFISPEEISVKIEEYLCKKYKDIKVFVTSDYNQKHIEQIRLIKDEHNYTTISINEANAFLKRLDKNEEKYNQWYGWALDWSEKYEVRRKKSKKCILQCYCGENKGKYFTGFEGNTALWSDNIKDANIILTFDNWQYTLQSWIYQEGIYTEIIKC